VDEATEPLRPLARRGWIELARPIDVIEVLGDDRSKR